MKKNLRIVSAAAAALLAVAPVAATAVATPATTFAAENDANQPVSTSVSTETKQANLQSAAENAVGAYINAHKPASNGFSMGGENFTGDVNFSFGDMKTTAGTPQVTSLNGQPQSAIVPVSLKSTVTVTVAATDDAKAKKATLTLGPSWGNTVYSTETTGNHQLNYKGIKNGVATYTFELPETVKVSFSKITPVAPAKPSTSTSINGGENAGSIFDTEANTSVNISAVAADKKTGVKSAINGNVTATIKGQTYTASILDNSATDKQNVTITDPTGKVVSANDLHSNTKYTAVLNDVTVNLGTANANTKVKFVLPEGSTFSNGKRTSEVNVDGNGVADLGKITTTFYAYDAADLQEVHFYSQKTGNVVTSGSVDLHAVNGKLSVQSVFAAMSQEYVASQLKDGKGAVDTLVPVNDIKAQLEKQNIKVDNNGYFTAPASFNINMNAKSHINGAEATLPVTVNVDNAAQTPAANETTKNVTVMHIATIYDKTGKATNEPALRAYNSVSVVSEPVTINGAKFYKLAGKDQYIKVGNIDGTSRSLKKNSYIYKSNGKAYTKKVGKKTKKTVKKAGSSVTTYGKSFMINGSQMYRVGKNQYIKKANF